jgi:hypothetical protein
MAQRHQRSQQTFIAKAGRVFCEAVETVFDWLLYWLERATDTLADMPGRILYWLGRALHTVDGLIDDYGDACGPAAIGIIILIIVLVVWLIHGVGQWWDWLTSHF